MANPIGVDDDEDQPALGMRDADDFAPAPLPIGPDGNPSPVGPVGNPPPLPAATADNWICLRGPCRHYMRMVGAGDFGNPSGTFEEGQEPKQRYHWCLAIPGQYVDMDNDMIFECNRWDPVDPDSPDELAKERRRSKYLKLHPEHDDAAEQEAIFRAIDDAGGADPDDQKYEATMTAAFAVPIPIDSKED